MVHIRYVNHINDKTELIPWRNKRPVQGLTFETFVYCLSLSEFL